MSNTSTSGSFIATVQEFFPEATDEEAMGILRSYTTFPFVFPFWQEEPDTCLREQLQHLVDVGPEQVEQEMLEGAGK